MDDSQLTDDQAAAVGFASMCCCLLAGVGLVVLIVWLVRGGQRQGSSRRMQPPAPVAAPQFAGAPAARPTPGGEVPQLSVLAVGFDARWRHTVESATSAPTRATNLLDARVELVQRAAKALLEVEPHWAHFGYGEKELTDLGAAQQSYQFAIDDFRARAHVPAEPLGTHVVAVLIIAARAHLRGVSTLDDRRQAHAALSDRLALGRDALLGAELLWAPLAGAISSHTVIQRFPEVRLLTDVPTGNG